MMFKRFIWSCLCLVVVEQLLLLQKMGELALSCFFDLGSGKVCGCVCMRLGTSGKGCERKRIV